MKKLTLTLLVASLFFVSCVDKKAEVKQVQDTTSVDTTKVDTTEVNPTKIDSVTNK